MSTLSGYGTGKFKQVDIAQVITACGTQDDDYKSTLSFPSDPAQNTTYSVPAVSQAAVTLLTDQSSLSVEKLSFPSSDGTVSSSDKVIVHDGSSDPVQVSVSELKEAMNISEVPGTGTAGQILLDDGTNGFVGTTMSGDATINESGALTIADDAISSAKIADDAVGTDQIADESVTIAKLANRPGTAGTAQAEELLQTDSNNDLASLNNLGCAQLTASGAVNGASVVFGAGETDQFRIKLDASNNLVFESSGDSGSTWTTRQMFTAS